MPNTKEPRWYSPRQVQEKLQCTRSHVYTLMKRNGFPQPIHLSKRSRRWDADLVDAWIAERLASGAV